MRILIIADTYPHAYKTYYDTHFSALVEEGHQVSIYSLVRPYYIEEGVDPASLRYRLGRETVQLPTLFRHVPGDAARLAWRMATRPSRSLANIRRSRGWEDSLRRRVVAGARAILLQEERPDICMLHGIDAALRVWWLRQLFPDTPVALYFHGSETPLRRWWGGDMLARGFALPDVVITNSSSSARNVEGRGCPAEKLRVIPLGFKLEEYVPPEPRAYRRDGVLRLLSAARQSPEKGHIHVLRALDLLRARGSANFHYTLTGEGPGHEELARFVSEHGLSEHVTFRGRMPREAVPRAMAEADVLLQPSLKIREWEENQACAVQEAMLMKTVVITTTPGGVRECIAPEMMPFCLPPADPEAIAAALEQLLEMPLESLVQLGERARRYAAENFEVHALNRRMIEATIASRPITAP